MSPTQKKLIARVRRAGTDGIVMPPTTSLISLEDKGWIKGYPDPDLILSVRYRIVK